VEYRISRVLCDARILKVFESAAEIQPNIVIKGLLAGRGQRPSACATAPA
jgi:(2S)-methylsuccinyl-CoA dehydrogenase